jgi:hypothetical protein
MKLLLQNNPKNIDSLLNHLVKDKKKSDGVYGAKLHEEMYKYKEEYYIALKRINVLISKHESKKV